VKFIRTICVIFIFCASSSLAQINVWRWQNPLPEGNFLYAVQMFSLTNIYACGDNGSFVRTSDGGKTCNLQSNVFKFNTPWNGLNFISENYGMLCGDSGRAVKTTDGGSTWKLMTTGTQSNLNGIILIDTNIALMITLHGGILRTTNGGESWYVIPFENANALYSIRKLRPDFLIVTGYAGTLLISNDIGISWHKVATPYANTFYCADFTDDNTATVIADNGLILHAVHGVWQQETVDSNAVTARLNDIGGKDPNILAMVGNNGTILYTTDGGNNWTQNYVGTNEHLRGISFFDTLNATAVGRDGVILRTTDGGKDWFFIPQTPEFTTLYSVAFPKADTSHGIGVGRNGTVKRTTNGGKEWLVSSITQYPLRSVCFLDSISAVAVGDYGKIFKTADAGITWNEQPSSTTRHLYSVSFATPKDGLAVGDSGTVLRTYTGGEFWTREFLGGGLPLECVSYPDVKHAFVVPSIISEDGGVNWKQRDLSAYPSISFCDSLHGAGTFSLEVDTVWNGLKSIRIDWYVNFTSDGGLTWYGSHLLYSETTGGNTAAYVQCVDRLRTTAVGFNGYIGHTTDGGNTWREQQSNTIENLFAVGFGSVQAGNAVGIRGDILRITTDELPLMELSVNSSQQSKRSIIIEGNYPNPFNTSTAVKYSLPSPGITTIEIFSIDGKLLAILETGYQSLGEHSLRFDRSTLSAGTYICRVTSNGLSAESKLLIEN
jgi:photosystem II stability/assembly factor-like uncharacterized protein